ncbi:hydantoinase B/oxoprolinase family protein [Mycolicibacterium cosmeticum]|uniref:hydantoinase B/oxoprolinase family protein n=1 Tax=Mycolicibacterium cosmeticum TaxID=258533 RepID=UPI003D16171D
MLRCITIISEQETVVDARFPAAIGKGPLEPAWSVSNLVSECFDRMLDTTPQTRRDVQSVCSSTYKLCTISGADERSGVAIPFVTAVFDTMAAGFGAQVGHDGVDNRGVLTIPQGRAPDIGMGEHLYPILSVWRREEPYSGVSSRHRGDVAASVCLISHGTSAPVAVGFAGGDRAINQNVGLAGGYPRSSQLDLIARGANALSALSSARRYHGPRRDYRDRTGSRWRRVPHG